MNHAILKNAWYVAAWSAELQDKPLSRTLLGHSVLLMRLSDGSVAAIGNRCPHRFAPLDRGILVNDTIQCGYHGLRFDRTGACVHAPGQGIPRARVPSYTVVERHHLIWLWGGDPVRADVNLVPDLSPLDDDVGHVNIVDNYMRAEADYLLVLDNLMDLSHVEFLHPKTLGSAGMSEASLTVRPLAAGVDMIRWMPGIQAPAFLATAMGYEGFVDHWLDVQWLAPSTYILRVGITAPGAGRAAGRESISYHLITPETSSSCHYFFGSTRDFDLDHPENKELQRAAVMRVFLEEDKPMVEACERMMAGNEFWSLQPVLLAGDAGAVQMRRVLTSLIAAENDLRR